MFKAILWDMDGTLVDTERVIWTVMQRSFREVASIDLPEEVFLSLLGQSEQDLYRAMAKEHALDDARVLAIREHYEAAYVPMLATVPPLPGAVEKVREFAGYAPHSRFLTRNTFHSTILLLLQQIRYRYLLYLPPKKTLK
jgi:beta-phosphoglucomutase-like phosphatase (HAD superfamily)